MKYTRGLCVLSLVTLVSLTPHCTAEESVVMSHPLPRDNNYTVTIGSLTDVYNVYPQTVEAITNRAAYVKHHTKLVINALEAMDPTCTKELFLETVDALCSLVRVETNVLELIQNVHPDEAVRKAAKDTTLMLQAYSIDMYASNKKIYELAQAVYATHTSSCTPEEHHLFKSIIREFKKSGLELNDQDKDRVTVLKKELNDLESTFLKNISTDSRTVLATKRELLGVSEGFITSLAQQDGKYVLRMDYPTADMVMGYCSVQETRKRYQEQFANRAYPANMPILDTVIAKRVELATLLGYESYAHLIIDGETMETPEKAWMFEKGLVDRALQKAEKEIAVIVKDLPAGVTLSPSDKLYPWDGAYITNYFKKKYYNIDEQEFAEYFPMEKTIAGLMDIYQQFFGVVITKVAAGSMWHEDVQLLQVADQQGQVLGYVFLDMYPRPNKYNHAAHFHAVYGTKNGKKRNPCVKTLVCNFTKPMDGKPSLLKYGEVTTFFHEFGHALHSVFGATEYVMQSGTKTERDFVELPSQMLENWMEEADILKMISSHYKTGEPLSDELIQKRLELLEAGTGLFVARQLVLGMVSLDMFDGKPDKDTSACMKKYATWLTPHYEYQDSAHGQCSFGHLMEYGPRYYGYLWTSVRGTDVFEHIKKEGLLNPAAGKRYVDCIIGRGGSIDGNTMVKDYLGREATYDAFYKKMGF